MELVFFLGAAFGSLLDPSHTLVWALSGYFIRNYILALMVSIGWRLFVQVAIVMPALEASQLSLGPYSTIAPIFSATVVTSIAWLVAEKRRRRASDSLDTPEVQPPQPADPVAPTQGIERIEEVPLVEDREKGRLSTVHGLWAISAVTIGVFGFAFGVASNTKELAKVRAEKKQLATAYVSLSSQCPTPTAIPTESEDSRILISARDPENIQRAIDAEFEAITLEVRSIPNHYPIDFTSQRQLELCRSEIATFEQVMASVSRKQEAAVQSIQAARLSLSRELSGAP